MLNYDWFIKLLNGAKFFQDMHSFLRVLIQGVFEGAGQLRCTVKPVLRDCSIDQKIWYRETGEKYAFMGLKGWSLNTGGLFKHRWS